MLVWQVRCSAFDASSHFFLATSGTKLRRRYGDLEEFEFEKLSEEDGLHVTIAISGWLDTTKKKKPGTLTLLGSNVFNLFVYLVDKFNML